MARYLFLNKFSKLVKERHCHLREDGQHLACHFHIDFWPRFPMTDVHCRVPLIYRLVLSYQRSLKHEETEKNTRSHNPPTYYRVSLVALYIEEKKKKGCSKERNRKER